MFVSYLQSMCDHGAWADAHLLRAVRGAAVDMQEVVRELAHVRGAQDIWLARIEGTTPSHPVWPEWSVDDLARASAPIDARLRAVIERMTPNTLAQPLRYTSLAGVSFETPMGGVLVHVLMHGHYHRGKANVALVRAGVAAESVDYISWQREALPVRT